MQYPEDTKRINARMNAEDRKIFPPKWQDELFQDSKRRCSACKTVQSLDSFGALASNRHGLCSVCKTCAYSQMTQWKRNNPDRVLEHQRTRRPRDRLRHSPMSTWVDQVADSVGLTRDQLLTQRNAELVSQLIKTHHFT